MAWYLHFWMLLKGWQRLCRMQARARQRLEHNTKCTVPSGERGQALHASHPTCLRGTRLQSRGWATCSCNYDRTPQRRLLSGLGAHKNNGLFTARALQDLVEGRGLGVRNSGTPCDSKMIPMTR